LIAKYVDARTEAHDLMWSQDAVSRLAEAQTIQASGGSLDKLARKRFVIPGPLWWAINWKSAKDHVDAAEVKPTTLPGSEPPAKGMVVLIDEIDKADSSVPNGLLECLGQQSFAVPGLDEKIVAKPPLPLVLLTSNDERPLPRAFVRRCVVLHLRLPSVEQELAAWLAQRGRAHFGGKLPDADIVAAAQQVVQDRSRVEERHRPGLAEYIDLLTALHRGVGRDAKQPIAALATFVLRKYDDPGEAPA
jgi:MoxR-like ATPase